MARPTRSPGSTHGSASSGRRTEASYSARNAGLAVSTGHLVSFLDSDDEWLPHFLALCTSYLRVHPEAAFVATEFLQEGSSRSVHPT